MRKIRMKKHHTLDIPDIQQRAVPILKKAGIIHSSIFGSAARGEAMHGSDIDMLIDFKKKMTLLDLVGLEQELELALGLPVDLVTRRSLHPALKHYIEKEEVFIM